MGIRKSVGKNKKSKRGAQGIGVRRQEVVQKAARDSERERGRSGRKSTRATGPAPSPRPGERQR
jgi:hypothetical protein